MQIVAKRNAKSDGQKSLKIPTTRLDEFQAWCDANNYQAKFVLFGGWFMLKTMSHDERMAHVNAAREWILSAENGGQSRAGVSPAGPGAAGATSTTEPMRETKPRKRSA